MASSFGMWLSLVEHLVRDQGVAGSNPVIPTIFKRSCGPLFPGAARFLSNFFPRNDVSPGLLASLFHLLSASRRKPIGELFHGGQ